MGIKTLKNIQLATKFADKFTAKEGVTHIVTEHDGQQVVHPTTMTVEEALSGPPVEASPIEAHQPETIGESPYAALHAAADKIDHDFTVGPAEIPKIATEVVLQADPLPETVVEEKKPRNPKTEAVISDVTTDKSGVSFTAEGAVINGDYIAVGVLNGKRRHFNIKKIGDYKEVEGGVRLIGVPDSELKAKGIVKIVATKPSSDKVAKSA